MNPSPKRRRRTSLWFWVGLRMSALAVGAVLSIALGMWLYFHLCDAWVLRGLPPQVRRDMLVLREHPRENSAQLWQLFSHYYDIEDVLPGLRNPDWWMLGLMVAMAVPIIVACGLVASRPLSRQLSSVARAAQRVSDGDFGARAEVVSGGPQELSGLASDFNGMTARLQQYERELRESSAMLAHELRTPLNAAMGRVQGMLDEVFPCDAAQLQLVHRQLKQINRLVGDLHLVSMARAGQLLLETDEFELHALVNERLQWAAPLLQQAALAVHAQIPAGLRVRADRDRLGQVLSILIDNVIRYAARGGALDIVATRDAAGLAITVGDHGPGVPAAELPRLLDRFWRADGSRARHSGGSGLGLAIAAAICQAHEGSLELTNRVPNGLLAAIRLSP